MKIGLVNYQSNNRHKQADELKAAGCIIVYGADEPTSIDRSLHYMPTGGILCVPNIEVLQNEVNVQEKLMKAGATLQILEEMPKPTPITKIKQIQIKSKPIILEVENDNKFSKDRLRTLIIVVAIIAIVIILEPGAQRDLTLTQVLTSFFIGGALSLWAADGTLDEIDIEALYVSLSVAAAIFLFNGGNPEVTEKLTGFQYVFSILIIGIMSLFLGAGLTLIIISGLGTWWLVIAAMIVLLYITSWIFKYWDFALVCVGFFLLWLFNTDPEKKK